MTFDRVIKKADHVNIRIADIDTSVRFYTDVLGFQVISTRDMRPSAKSVSTYVGRDGLVIELAWGHDPAACSTNGIVNHFALEVYDINRAVEYFRQKNVEVLCDIIPVNKDFLCFFIAGPTGEKIEIIQYLTQTA